MTLVHQSIELPVNVNKRGPFKLDNGGTNIVKKRMQFHHLNLDLVICPINCNLGVPGHLLLSQIH